MFKSLRVPEKLFAFVMWLVSFVFAGFLIGLGGKIVADLPRVEDALSLEQFAEPQVLERTRDEIRALERRQAALGNRRAEAQLAFTAAGNAYASARDAYDKWIQTRTATADPAQDPEVLVRTRALDDLKAAERRAQAALEQIDAEALSVNQATARQRMAEGELLQAAQPAYQRALFAQELRVFGARW